MSGSGNPFYNKTHSEETRAIIRESRKGNTNYLLSPEFLAQQSKERSGFLNDNARRYSY
jgi:hypothetical protein